MKSIKTILLTLIFILPLFASNNLEKVSLQLNWKYQFEFAGFIAAKEKGFYKDLGLDVDIKEFTDGVNVIDDVKNEKVTFGIYDTSYLNLYDPNKPIVLLANYFKRPALVFITKQDIVVPNDLKGKKVMYVKNELDHSSIGTLLKRHKIKPSDLISIDHNFTAEKFISGEVDAMSAFISNELYHVIESKVPYRIMDPQNYGITEGGLNLFTSLNETKANPKMVTNFLMATKRGWQYALDNKEEIVNIIYEKYSQIKSKDALLFEANETQKLMMNDVYEIGEILENLVNQRIKKLEYEHKTNNKIPIETLLFNYKKHIDSVMTLTKEEKKYIQNKKEITMCIDPDWMPYERILNGKHIGMTSEYMPLISKKIGLPIRMVPTSSWSQSIDYAKQRKCDIFSLAMQTPSRLKYMNFTTPYISFPIVVATKTDKLFVSSPEELVIKEKIGIVKGYSIGEILKQKYPNHKIIDVNSVDEGMKLVTEGKLYGFIGALPTIAYSIQHKYLSELKITGKLESKLALSVGVRSDDQILLELFQKALLLIDESKKQEILNKYISIQVESGFDYELLYKILTVIIIIIVFGVYRHTQLLKYNKKLEKKQIQLNRSNEELKVTQDMLKASIKDFEILLDSVLEAIFVFEDKICIDANSVAIKMYGYENRDEVIGKHISEFVTKESYEDVLEKSVTGDNSVYELNAVKKDGEVFDIIARGSNVVINSKEVRISAIVDVSEMKNKEQILFQQSKMAAMGQMLENIAHQWRQPLSLISSISTALEVKKEINVTTKEEELGDLKRINLTAQHLSQTIDDFRNFFKSDKVMNEFSIISSIERNFSLLEGMLKNNNITVVFDKKEDAIINSYENEFTQALINIFYNAKDAMGIEIKDKYIFVDVERKSNFVHISIKDSGGGIDENIIENIFEPYFTTKHKAQGTGIGLYMTHLIIEKHMKGSISVENSSFEYDNKQLKGANFIIKLPL